MAEENAENVILPEEADYEDSDSGFESVGGSSTTSITSSIQMHREENGRRYHAYEAERNYVLPNDEIENDRLDLQHHLFSLTLDQKLYTCPKNRFHQVLDVGTGTGIWALDFADEHPEAQVTGVDLSPIQPLFIAPNAKFLLDDIEKPWMFSTKFDFIHVRMMTGSISDWPKFIHQSFENLIPDGYIEIADITFPIQADDETLPEHSALKRWSDLMLEASKKLERPLDSAKSYHTYLAAAGFSDVTETEYKWPQNRWPKDPKFKELGLWAYENISNGLQGLSLALFTRGLGWSVEELELLLVEVRSDMKNLRIHSYWSIRVVTAKKPAFLV